MSEPVLTIPAGLSLLDKFTRLTGVSAHPYMDTTTVFLCDECACVFLPDDDGTTLYPDRWANPREPHGCECHALDDHGEYGNSYPYTEETDA